MSDEKAPVEQVAEQAAENFEKTAEEVIQVVTENGKKIPKPGDFRQVLRGLKKELEETMAEEGMSQQGPDPDRFLKMAKQVVVDNYNNTKNSKTAPDLTLNTVFIIWYAKVLNNWKAIVGSPIARGMLWEVSFNGHRNQAYIDIYKKLANAKVDVEEAK